MAFKKQRMGRKKVCYFTQNHIEHIDFKDVDLLRKFAVSYTHLTLPTT